MSLKTTSYPKKMMKKICFDCTSCVDLVIGFGLGAGVVVVGARGSVGVGIACVEGIACVACEGANVCLEVSVYLLLLFGNLVVDSSLVDVVVNDENQSDARENPVRFGRAWIWVCQQF